MLGRFKDATLTVISKSSKNTENNGAALNSSPKPKERSKKPEKYAYARPYFLGLDKDEVTVSQDFGMRPILKPRNIKDMPLLAGYAEYVDYNYFA